MNGWEFSRALIHSMFSSLRRKALSVGERVLCAHKCSVSGVVLANHVAALDQSGGRLHNRAVSRRSHRKMWRVRFAAAAGGVADPAGAAPRPLQRRLSKHRDPAPGKDYAAGSTCSGERQASSKYSKPLQEKHAELCDIHRTRSVGGCEVAGLATAPTMGCRGADEMENT